MHILAHEPKTKNMSLKQRLAIAYDYCSGDNEIKDFFDFIEQAVEKEAEIIYIDNCVDFIADALSLHSWREKRERMRFFAPDMPLFQAATAGKKTSANIAWIGYNNKNLRVGFIPKPTKKNPSPVPSVYEYDVEPEFYEAMAAAESKGKFLWNYLRGKTPGRVIDAPERWTPGGVGGSLVPYNKLAPRRISSKEIKQLQKKFASHIERGTSLQEIQFKRLQKPIERMMGMPSKLGSPGKTAFLGRIEKVKSKLRKKFGLDFTNTCDYNENGTCIDKRNKYYQKECPYENIDKCPTADFTTIDTRVKGHWKTVKEKKIWVEGYDRAENISKADKTYTAINKEYNWIATAYLGRGKLTHEEKLRRIERKIEALQELLHDPKLDKKVLQEELKKLTLERKMWNHYLMGEGLEGEFGKERRDLSEEYKQQLLKEKGKWVTIRGRKVFLPEGKNIHWKKDGEYKMLSAQAYKFNKAYLVGKHTKKQGISIEEAKTRYSTQQKERAVKAKFQKPPKSRKRKAKDTISVRETENYTRKRQFEPSDCETGTHRTFNIGKGKKAIGCKRKSTGKFEVQSILEPKTKSDFFIPGENYLTNLNENDGIPFVIIQDFPENKAILVIDRWITKNKRHIWIENTYSVEEVNEALEPFGIETSPWFKIDKGVDIKGYYTAYRLSKLAKAMDILPLGIKNMIKEIRIYNKGVGEDPYFVGVKDEIPISYKRIGSKRTYRTIGGIYLPRKNIAILGGDSKFSEHSLRHEIAHAVWRGISFKDKEEFFEIFNSLSNYWTPELGRLNLIRIRRGDYEANDIEEFFAESFQNYYYAQFHNERQKQGFSQVSTFFRRRMKKYE